MPHVTRRNKKNTPSVYNNVAFRPIDAQCSEDTDDVNTDNDSPSLQTTSDNSKKFASTASMYFSKRQFSCDIDDSRILTLRDYLGLAVQLKRKDKQKSTHFVNWFGKPALSFFLMNTTPSHRFKHICDIRDTWIWQWFPTPRGSIPFGKHQQIPK